MSDKLFTVVIIILAFLGFVGWLGNFFSPKLTLEKDDWTCTRTRQILVGKLPETQCIRLERKP